jgi:hypothetical protein
VPLGAAHFPLLPAHARPQLVREQGLQTTTGFTTEVRQPPADPRTRVRAVEVGSPAARAGVRPGDLVVKVDGQPNTLFIDVTGPEEKWKDALKRLEPRSRPLPGENRTRLEFDDPAAFLEAWGALRADVPAFDLMGQSDFPYRKAFRGPPGVLLSVSDRLDDAVREWPRGRSKLVLGVQRTEGGKDEIVDLPPFAPATVGLYPTQLYETVSMVVLILFLLAYYPYRRHDGQLMVLLMIGYAIHRFINESLRIEPAVGTGLTLSQWGSVVIFVAAVGIEVFLWCTMPSRWGRGPAPTSQPAPASPVGPAAAPQAS